MPAQHRRVQHASCMACSCSLCTPLLGQGFLDRSKLNLYCDYIHSCFNALSLLICEWPISYR